MCPKAAGWGLVPSGGVSPGFTGCCFKPCLCAQGLEEPQPGSETLSGAGGQDPLEKSYLLPKEELARTWEDLTRFKGSVQLEEKKPLELLKGRVSCCPNAMSRAGSGLCPGWQGWVWTQPHPAVPHTEHSRDAGTGQELGAGSGR